MKVYLQRQSGVKKAISSVTLVLAIVLLGGCISTTEGGFTEKASPQKALEKRVALARQYIGEGNWDDAKRNLEIAYNIDSRNSEVHEAFALVYQSTGEVEFAEKHYKTSIQIDSACSRCRNNYAVFLYSQAKYKEAEKQLELVVEDSLYSARPRAFINLGLCRQRLDNIAGAEQAFERVLAMERTNAIALLELAHLRYDAQDYSRASNYYDTYTRVTRQQSARSLLLGIRLAEKTGDRDARASYVLSLSNRFPESAEYQAYQRARESD